MKIATATFFALAALQAAAPAIAQDAKPMRMIVPFPPGGGNDILGRTVAQHLAQVRNQQIIVENRGAAGGLIGADLAAHAAPAGYTMVLASIEIGRAHV